MSTINTNVMSINAQRNLASTTGSLSTSMQRLSSGLRVNSAKDDAAGLAIATRMDSQYRGMRYYIEGKGSHTANSHFTRDVLRPDGSAAYVGYGKDSLIACLLGVLRIKFMGATLADVAKTYPDAEEGRLSTAIIHAARLVRDKNYAYLQNKMGAPVTACLGATGITILDPYGQNASIYGQAI